MSAATPGAGGVRRVGRTLLWIVTAGVFLFQFAPVVVVVFFSFNESRSVNSFTGFSLGWYEKFFSNAAALEATMLSIGIAFACGVVAVIVGSLLALGMQRLSRRESAASNLLIGLVFTTPEVAMGASLLLLFSSIGFTLSPVTVLLGHVTFSLSYVVFVVRARLNSLRLDVEEAAADLGATRMETLRLVILPQLWPALFVSFMLVFLLSFDDFVTSFFTSGLEAPTLPVYIYGMLRRGLTPEINVIGTLMAVIALLLGLLGCLIAARRDRAMIRILQ
ncbi:ABC transporter permease [Leucobacter sp. CSA1]|uniref:ABC transporter permease n=1 Tax=Leucobacter chromiisoli TaxID=2796471 RepID=A0A934Q9J9_9MICO|nr:ABC transporter permease [Leucobacter chromiisoli]MBK0420416.1 ABC transporter permease [Leucobacter chromiisoli]